MKTYLKPLFLFSSCALAAISTLNAGAPAVVATDPVGYVSTTTPNGDDALLGLPLAQAAALSTVAGTISGAEVTVSATLVADAYNNTHYVLATSGANAGQWSEVVDTSVSSITTADALLAETDTFNVIPFWTLDTAFVDGAGVGASTNPAAPVATVLVNDPTATGINLSPAATYLYFTDGGTNDGWYNANTFDRAGGIVLAPDAYVIIRNNTGGSVTTIVTGTVPVNPVGSTIARQLSAQQDSQLVNPYPSGLSLDDSGLASVLTATTNPASPEDTVLIYNTAATSGINISPAATYLYFTDGGTNDGWYNANTFDQAGAVEIPAGGAFLVRRSAGAAELVDWNPAVPYAGSL